MRSLKGRRDLSRYHNDPVAYARDVLQVSLTPDQECIAGLVVQPPYKVLVKAAHNVGKCVHHADKMTLANGEVVDASSLVGKEFRLLTLVDGEVVEADAKADWNGFEPVYEVVTETGHVVRRTAAHPLWVTRGRFQASTRPVIPVGDWTRVDAISPGDLVAVPDEFPAFGNEPMPEHEIKILAYLIGDGGMTTASISFTQQDNRQLEEFKGCVTAAGARVVKRKGALYGYGVKGDGSRWKRTPNRNGGVTSHRINPVRELLERHGLMRKRSRDKRVPPAVFRLPKHQLATFLSRLFSTDGWACLSRNGCAEIGFCSISEGLARDVQDLLLRFGIRASIRRRDNVNAWVVDFRDMDNLKRFASEIGIFGKETQVAAVANAKKHSRRQWRTRNVPAGCRWEKVKSVEQLPQAMTVAIEVPGHHTYLTPALYEHNSFLAAVLVNWWYDTRDPGVCLTTAPTDKQVRDILWKEIRRLRGQRGGFRGPKMPRLESSEDHFAHGFTARDSNAFQGQHEANVGIVFDEAEGIDPDFWEAAETMLGGHSYFMLAIYNPTTSTSQTAIEEREGGWHQATLSALNHPNIALELDGKPPLVPQAIRLSRLEEQLAKWSEKIPEEEPGAVELRGQWYRPGLVAQARLLGIRPTTGFDSVFPEWAFDRACETYLDPAGKLRIGCDVARFGDDFTAIHARRGGRSLRHESGNGWDSIRVAERCKDVAYAVARSEGLDPRKDTIFVVDGCGGYGGGPVDLLRADGWMVIELNASLPAAGQEEQYPNLRSALWFGMAEEAAAGNVSWSGLSDDVLAELRKQFTGVKYTLDVRGRRVVEPKAETKARLKRSPDDADATLLAFSAIAEPR